MNVIGAIDVARHAVAYRRAHHDDGVVNVSSTAVRKGMANEYIDYAASKVAIETLTLDLVDELASEGIRVNAVRPRLIETDTHAKGGVPNRISQLAHTTPLERAGTPQELAAAILCLLSDEASYTKRSIRDVAGAGSGQAFTIPEQCQSWARASLENANLERFIVPNFVVLAWRTRCMRALLPAQEPRCQCYQRYILTPRSASLRP